jgi:NAD-dependent histone deacetylase SIR2
MEKLTAKLREVGLVTFLRDYLTPVPGVDGEIPSLRKLILGFGIIPVSSPTSLTLPNLR